MPDRLVTELEYEALLADRPRKFNAEQVGFQPESDSSEVCCSCMHYFVNPCRETKVCEIVRLDNEIEIPPLAKCQFWTADGFDHPLLEEE